MAIYPVALAMGAAAAVSAAGTAAAAAGQAKANRAMDDAKRAELMRQKGYQDQAAAAWQQSLSKGDPGTAQQQLQQGQQTREQAYAKAQAANIGSPTGAAGVGPGNRMVATASPVAAREQSAALATNNAWTKAMNNAGARLGSYEDWGLGQDTKNAWARQQIASVGNQARGSAGVLQYEMEDAKDKGNKLKTLGEILQAIGSTGGSVASEVAFKKT
jgi:hypothetical protein